MVAVSPSAAFDAASHRKPDRDLHVRVRPYGYTARAAAEVGALMRD